MSLEQDVFRAMEARISSQEQRIIDLSADLLHSKSRCDVLEENVKEFVEFSRTFKTLLKILRNLEFVAKWVIAIGGASVIVWAILKFVIFQAK